MPGSLAVSYTTKHTLTTQSSNCALRICPKGAENYVHAKTYTRILIAALFVIAKTWKQPRCPPGGKWINSIPSDSGTFGAKNETSYQAVQRLGANLNAYQ